VTKQSSTRASPDRRSSYRYLPADLDRLIVGQAQEVARRPPEAMRFMPAARIFRLGFVGEIISGHQTVHGRN
jgi:hypothetical protein